MICPFLLTVLPKSLILLCTHNVQFLFDNKLFFQKDGVAMGSPLGPILADIFMGYVENFLCVQDSSSPRHYFRFVDDTFCAFNNVNEALCYLEKINKLHPNLSFTFEKEVSGSLPFLDVLVQKADGSIFTSVYRKPTFSGLYLHFFSFAPSSYKRNLVRNLFDRAHRICSPSNLPAEKNFLTEILMQNGYPPHFIEKYSKSQPPQEVFFGPEKKTAYITLPFLGDRFSSVVRRRVRAATALAFKAIEPKFLFTTRKLPVRPLKDQLPLSCASNLVYRFTCDCGSSYVGRTVRRLSKRVDEHLPTWAMQKKTRPRSKAEPSSAVTRHICACPQFHASMTKISFFDCVAKARHPLLLPYLEATYIAAMKPSLCVQKETTMTLALPW